MEETTDPNERCDRCSNYLSICGHNLPFAERMRHIQVDKSWMSAQSDHNPKL